MQLQEKQISPDDFAPKSFAPPEGRKVSAKTTQNKLS
jgi:hypothetical protein